MAERNKAAERLRLGLQNKDMRSLLNAALDSEYQRGREDAARRFTHWHEALPSMMEKDNCPRCILNAIAAEHRSDARPRTLTPGECFDEALPLGSTTADREHREDARP